MISANSLKENPKPQPSGMAAARVGTAAKIWHDSKPLRKRVLALREIHKAGENVGLAEVFDDLSELEKEAKMIKKDRKKARKKLRKQRKKQAKMEEKVQRQRRKRRQQRRRRKARTQPRPQINPYHQSGRRPYNPARGVAEYPDDGMYMRRGERRNRSQTGSGPRSKFWKKFNELVDDLFAEPSRHETRNRPRRS